jgi:hypothetical protein
MSTVTVLAYAYVRPLIPLYDLVTPTVLAVGAGLAAYGVRLDVQLGRRPHRAATVALYAVLTRVLPSGADQAFHYRTGICGC